MDRFSDVSEDELLTVYGRGGGSDRGGPDDTPSRSSSSSSKPSSQSYAKPASAGLSSHDKTKQDEIISAKSVATANALAAKNTPYGTVGYAQSAKEVGKVVSLSASNMDCSAAMSAISGNPYQTCASLSDPKVAAANGYTKAVTNRQAGTWTVVQYRDPKTGEIEGHTQMSMGNGQYFDSVAYGGGGRKGPSLTGLSVEQYLAKEGITPISVSYLRPTR